MIHQKSSSFTVGRLKLRNTSYPLTVLIACCLLFLFDRNSIADEGIDGPAADKLSQTVQAYFGQYCVHCHGAEKQEAKLDLSGAITRKLISDHHQAWTAISQRISSGEMPPESESNQPSRADSERVVQWIQGVLNDEARRNAGDPGIVLARRLSHAEYDRTICDLTGHDLRPTREFPVDPANEMGFDNTGESLTMSPALVSKYLNAARAIADHLVLTPDNLEFASHPVVTETDRDKYCVHRIVRFYQEHDVDYADYFYACWRFVNRDRLGTPTLTLDEIADADLIQSTNKNAELATV